MTGKQMHPCAKTATRRRVQVYRHAATISLVLLGALGFGSPASAQPTAPMTPSAIRAAVLHAPALAPGYPEDRWLARDKVQHAVFSFLWTLGSQYTLVNKFDVRERRALPWSVAASAAVGLAKEGYDAYLASNNYFSPRDLAADAAGIALAVALILL